MYSLTSVFHQRAALLQLMNPHGHIVTTQGPLSASGFFLAVEQHIWTQSITKSKTGHTSLSSLLSSVPPTTPPLTFWSDDLKLSG
jgi:hypothetical protein